jgi:hypothetical protein
MCLERATDNAGHRTRQVLYLNSSLRAMSELTDRGLVGAAALEDLDDQGHRGIIVGNSPGEVEAAQGLLGSGESSTHAMLVLVDLGRIHSPDRFRGGKAVDAFVRKQGDRGALLQETLTLHCDSLALRGGDAVPLPRWTYAVLGSRADGALPSFLLDYTVVKQPL